MSKQPKSWIKNSKTYTSVLYLGRPSSILGIHLAEILAKKGALSMSIHPDSKLICASVHYDCYIIDAGAIGHIKPVMRRILAAHSDARILVVSDQFDWREAVDAFDLGAIDVIRQPRNITLTRHILQVILNQTLPRRQAIQAFT